jgi:hypothetical protein
MNLHVQTNTSLKDNKFSVIMPDEDLTALERAIALTVSYSDVFDYPLTVREIHRYLIGVQASLETVNRVLVSGQHITRLLTYQQGYFFLRGRDQIVGTRQRRADIAARLWHKARIYGNLIALLPFTRMVAVTGALAVDNTEGDADIDFMIVTEPGRLWLCRALVILLVRWAALHSDTVCPNLFVSENALVYQQQDLYTAHEMAQMIPITGYRIYRQMMELNPWTLDYLPNIHENYNSQMGARSYPITRRLGDAAEKILRASWMDSLERWEMTRKIRKFSQMTNWSNEANFSVNWCQGYFNAHELQTLLAYRERVKAIEAAWSR